MDTRRVEIVFSHDPETDGPDLRPDSPTRIGSIHDLPKAQARSLVNSGAAVYADVPRDDHGRALEDLTRRQAVALAAEAGIAVTPTTPRTQIIAKLVDRQQRADAEAAQDELGKLTRDELRARLDALNSALPEGAEPVEVPANARKDELVEAVQRAEQASRPAAAIGTKDGGAPIVTVLPGAAGNPTDSPSNPPPTP